MPNKVWLAATAVSWLAAVAIIDGSTAKVAPAFAWTAAEIAELRSMSLAALEPLPADPSNRVAADPRAARLGERLFNDRRLSANGEVACATCHRADMGLQDGLPLGRGIGTAARRTMAIGGAAYAPFLFWDGRKDSLWAQALGPFESAVEHGTTRAHVARVIAMHYSQEYREVFGALPDLAGVPAVAGPVDDAAAARAWAGMTDLQREEVTRVFVNAGKAIAAFERQVRIEPAPFDDFVAALSATGVTPDALLSAEAIAGLRLFTGKAQCTRCHNGPLLTNYEFHNTGVPAGRGSRTDTGRFAGALAVLDDEFNCRSRWSDAQPSQCRELEFLVTREPQQRRAFKVPSLRNVAGRAPYMDAGQFATLAEVLDHYNRAPAAPAGHSELEPLHLDRGELRQLEAFLRTLSGSGVTRTAPGAKRVGGNPRSR